jgi:hypothetical protein
MLAYILFMGVGMYTFAAVVDGGDEVGRLTEIGLEVGIQY